MTILTALSAPITGTLNFTGNAQLMPGEINFKCDLLGVCSGSNGDFFITGGAANSGEFAAISILDRFGQVQDLVGAPGPLAIPNFATFTATNDVVLNLTTLFAGVGGPCPPTGSSVCTPTTAPALNVSVTPTGSVATFSVLANAVRVSTGETTPYKGLFTLQFTQPPSTVLASIASGSTLDTSYSASFSPQASPTPEPSSWLMIGSGIGLLLFGVRKQRRA